MGRRRRHGQGSLGHVLTMPAVIKSFQEGRLHSAGVLPHWGLGGFLLTAPYFVLAQSHGRLPSPEQAPRGSGGGVPTWESPARGIKSIYPHQPAAFSQISGG